MVAIVVLLLVLSFLPFRNNTFLYGSSHSHDQKRENRKRRVYFMIHYIG